VPLHYRTATRLRFALARFSGWPRRLLALALLAAAGVVAMHPAPSAAPARASLGRVVLVAAHDMAAGRAVRRADLKTERLPALEIPAGAMSADDASSRAVAGRVLGAPMRRGEVLTDVRLIGPALAAAAGGHGAVAVPVRVTDADVVSLLRPGDRIDVLAGPAPDTGAAVSTPLAIDVPVIAVPPHPDESVTDGAIVVIAAPIAVARLVATASTGRPIMVSLRAP